MSELARERGLLALALEAEVQRAVLLAEEGDLDAAIVLARQARADAVAVESAVIEVWAHAVAANLRLRQDVDAGLDEVSVALAAARRIDYPAAVTVNLRSRAWGLTRAGRSVAAAETLTELFAAAGGGQRRRHPRRALLHRRPAPPNREPGMDRGLRDRCGAAAHRPDGSSARCASAAAPAAALRRCAAHPPRCRRRWPGRNCRPTSPGCRQPPAPPSSDHVEARFVDRGAYWEVSFAGRAAHAKAGKGMADISRLLSTPGRESTASS